MWPAIGRPCARAAKALQTLHAAAAAAFGVRKAGTPDRGVPGAQIVHADIKSKNVLLSAGRFSVQL